ncbi:MAG TPA: class I SAM-dependent methyltransferase [Azospirillum sp.]|nr:class I SAM-dependent methyltransferase [Azospirillum sp.]
MFFIGAERHTSMAFMPKGGVYAEIGVKQGTFAKTVREKVAPREMHLIDPWAELNGDYRYDPNNANNAEQEQRYQSVVAAFAGDQRVHIHRELSTQAVERFPDHYFDFVYVDADHGFNSVLIDLQIFARKVKPSGMLVGHDFCSHTLPRKHMYGVIGAVTEFVKQSEYELKGITNDEYSTYFLARRESAYWDRFIANLIMARVPLLELPNEIAGNYRHKTAIVNGQGSLIPSFKA